MKKSMLLIILLYFSMNSAIANEFLDKIIDSCISDGSIGKYGFREIIENSENDYGQSRYSIGNRYEDDGFYSNKNLVSNSNYSKLWFYSTLKNIPGKELHNLIWHVIITPSDIQNKHNIRGYIGKRFILTSLSEGLITKNNYHYLIDRNSLNDNDYFINNPANNTNVEKGINELWEHLFSTRNMRAIYKEIQKKEPPYYDYSFTLHKIDIDSHKFNIERGGYLTPSSKLVMKQGKAYGLILDKNGDCIEYATIDIK